MKSFMMIATFALWFICLHEGGAGAGELPTSFDVLEKLDEVELAKLPDVKVPLGKPLGKSALSGKNVVELRMMRNSIYAQCGFEFKTPWLSKYFKSRSWYREGSYRPEKLGKVDRENVRRIQEMEKRIQRPISFVDITSLTPSELKKLPDLKAPLDLAMDEKKLVGLGPTELALLRNSIFAQYGRRFKTKWIQDYFDSRTWYRPGDFSNDELTATDHANVRMMIRFEKSKKQLNEAAVLRLSACAISTGWETQTFQFKPGHAAVLHTEFRNPYGGIPDKTVRKGTWKFKKPDLVEFRIANKVHYRMRILDVAGRRCALTW